jgi:hypothetical protein
MITYHICRCPDCRLQFGSRRELRRHRREAHRPARPSALIRLADALRVMHREQVYAMECLLRLRQPPEAGPLTWVRTPSCCQLAGWYRPQGPRTPAATAARDPRKRCRAAGL